MLTCVGCFLARSFALCSLCGLSKGPIWAGHWWKALLRTCAALVEGSVPPGQQRTRDRRARVVCGRRVNGEYFPLLGLVFAVELGYHARSRHVRTTRVATRVCTRSLALPLAVNLHRRFRTRPLACFRHTRAARDHTARDGKDTLLVLTTRSLDVLQQVHVPQAQQQQDDDEREQ